MPASATTTSYSMTTFVTRTTITIASMNSMWGAYRGHLIPIDPTAVAASPDVTYDLGASDHRWRTNYIRTLDLWTGSTAMSFDATGSTFNFNFSGTSSLRFRPSGFSDNAVLKAFRSANQAVVSGGTNIAYNTQTADTHSLLATATGNITIATTGYYLIMAQHYVQLTTGSNQVEFWLRANDLTNLSYGLWLGTATASENTIWAHAVSRLVAGDVINARLAANGILVMGGASTYQSKIELIWLRPG